MLGWAIYVAGVLYGSHVLGGNSKKRGWKYQFPKNNSYIDLTNCGYKLECE